MAAIMLCSVFVGMKSLTTHADITNGMAMNPTLNVVTLPAGGSDMTFLYELNITTTVSDVSAWEAKLLWDPAVLRVLGVTWGTFMTGGDLTNSSTMSASGEWVLFGQNFDEQITGVHGSGILAYVHFTFVIPGATFIQFVEAKVWDDSLNENNLLAGSVYGQVTCGMAHPQFTWATEDHVGNPLPSKTVYDGGRTVNVQTSATNVTFNASLTYDVGMITWNYTSFQVIKPGPLANIVALLWNYGDGSATDYYTTTPVNNFSATASHIYANYLKAGYVVNLTAWDGSGSYWSSTWRFQGSAPADTVPMWRDLAIVDIWPSLIPYEIYANGTGSDWYATWWYDSTDFNLPNTADPYWNYQMPYSYTKPSNYDLPNGTTVKQAWVLLGNTPGLLYGDEGPGLNVLVTANNFGTVPEKALINLYAIALTLKTTGVSPSFNPLRINTVELIGTWKKTINPGAGTGWACTTNWMPSANATYVLLATIDAQDGAVIQDQDRSNNYMLLSTPVSNINVWNFTSGAMVTPGWINSKYLCDFTNDGQVTGPDLNFFLSNYGSNSKATPYKAPISKP